MAVRLDNTRVKACYICQKIFVGVYNKITCSQECKESYRFFNSLLSKNCSQCSKGFLTDRKHNNFCKLKCRQNYTGKKLRGRTWTMNKEGRQKISKTRKERIRNGSIVISPKSSYSKHTYYKNKMFRSSWEAKVAKYLDKKEIKWEYESKLCRFKLSNRSVYVVDFYLPELKKWLEVKGYWKEYDFYKCSEFIKKNGYDSLIIVDGNNIEDISLNKLYYEYQTEFMYSVDRQIDDLKEAEI